MAIDSSALLALLQSDADVPRLLLSLEANAVSLGEPLLCVGNDFAQTDVITA